MLPNLATLVLVTVVLLSAQTQGLALASDSDALIIDDFQSGNGQSVFGTRWEGFSDRVMGGLSDLNLSYQRLEDDRLALRLQGQVRLENNGGFIQARLPLNRDGQRFDASDWQGVRITTRAQPGAYYIHLRTRATWLPWQYYGARIPIQADWEWVTLDIPFGVFDGESTRRKLDVSSLKSIGIVAYGEAFEADIEVSALSFYR